MVLSGLCSIGVWFSGEQDISEEGIINMFGPIPLVVVYRLQIMRVIS